MKETFVGPKSEFNIGLSYVEAQDLQNDKKATQPHKRIISMLRKAFRKEEKLQQEGWSVSGFYRTRTTKDGENTFVMKGALHAINIELSEASKIMVVWVFGDAKGRSSEVLSCQWDPEKTPKGFCSSESVTASPSTM